MGIAFASPWPAQRDSRRHGVSCARRDTIAIVWYAGGAQLLRAALLAAGLLGLTTVAAAQVDPEPRANLELGAEAPLRGNGGVSGYAFFLWNRPHFLDEDLYWRLVVAPTFLMSELVHDGWPAPGHALGVGVDGGLFQNDFDEFRDGQRKKRESFDGDGGEGTLSYYRRLTIADRLPLEGQLRLKPRYVEYERGGDTDPRFRLPADTMLYAARIGVRLGGEPPELLPKQALEISVWHEPTYRQVADSYGLPDRPQELHSLTQRTWGRVGGVFPLWETQVVRLFVSAGTAEQVDALSSFRLGGALRFRSDFPLVLHGYYPDEIMARKFWLANFSYRMPAWPGSQRVQLQLSADYAQVEYLPGHSLPRKQLRGVGLDVPIALTSGITVVLGYGYGVDAPRGAGFGGHEASMLIEVKF